MSSPSTNKYESQKKDEDDSMIWQTYAVKNRVILEDVIREIVQRKDQVPSQLFEIADAILKTSLGIVSLKNHMRDFERLLGVSSTLLVVFWKSNNAIKANLKYQSLPWPPPKLRKFLDELVDTVCCIHEFMRRKCEKNVVKRILVGCFGIRDLGKFDRYQRRLDSVALGLKSRPHNIDICAVLLAVVDSPAQPHTEVLVEGDASVKKCAKKKAADQPPADDSRLRQVGKPINITAKHAANHRADPEDIDEDNPREKNKAKDNIKHECVEERSREDEPDKRTDKCINFDQEAQNYQDNRKPVRHEEPDADLKEGTSAQGARKNNAAQSKTKKKPRQAYEEEESNGDTTSKRKRGSRMTLVSPETLAPLSHRSSTISDFSESSNNGAVTIVNENIGNIYSSTVSDVGGSAFKRGKPFKF